jgi:hypothetical protein
LLVLDSVLGGGQQRIEFSAVRQTAIDYYGFYLPCVRDVLQRIGRKQEQIREFPLFYASNILLHTQESRGSDCRALDCLRRGQPGAHQQTKLVVERESSVCVGLVPSYIGSRPAEKHGLAA